MISDEDKDSTSKCRSVGSTPQVISRARLRLSSTCESLTCETTPQVSIDDSDGRKSKLNGNEVSLVSSPDLHPRKACEQESLSMGLRHASATCHAPAFDLRTNDATWSTSFCPPSDERTSETTAESSL